MPGFRLGFVVAAAAAAVLGCAAPASAPQRSVYFIEPADGAQVASPFKVKFGLRGMAIRPAGEVADGTGHHHLLIDTDGIASGAAIPADDRHLHFGKGQTETDVTLPPGRHRLTLQFADGNHVSYGAPLSASIVVTVTR